jgi:hypothetical protein
MSKDGYTYSQYPTSELTHLWKTCLKPGGNALTLLPNETGKGKDPGDWVSIDHAIGNGESFFVNLPHHLIALDLDSPMPEDGTGQKVLDYLNGQGIYFVVATSGSSGWVIIVNLWTTLTGSEKKTEYLTENFDKKIAKLKQELEVLSPDRGWASRVRRSIRPPLSPYPYSGTLQLISPSTVLGAAKILNYGGVVFDGINPHPESLAKSLNLTTPREIRAPYFMSLADVMIQAGYHFEDFREILTETRSPIGRLYNERVIEHKRNHKWVEKDLATTWEKSFKFVQQNPPMGEARRLLPEWVLFAWDTVIKSDYSLPTKTRLIACIFAIANIGYSACTLNPVIGENRLEKVSGVSRKSLSPYKKILHNLGLVTISYEETPNSDKHYGTMFRIQISSVSFTDIGSLLITTMGNRDITSVNRVNDFELKHQITELIKTWQPHALWLSEPSGRVKGHLVWTLLKHFPTLQIEHLCKLLKWSQRTSRDVLIQLRRSSLIYWDDLIGEWTCYTEDGHWDNLVGISMTRTKHPNTSKKSMLDS